MHILLIIVPIVFGALCLGLPGPRLRLTALVAGAFAHLAVVVWSWQPDFPAVAEQFFGVDPLGHLFVSLISVLFAATSVYFVGYHKKALISQRIFLACMLGLLAALSALCVSQHLGMLWVAMFWGGFFASTWIPSYAQLKDTVPPQVVATAMGILNLFFWLGGAVYQQVSGLILAEFPRQDAHAPVAGYQALFWLCLGSVGLSVVLVALSKEERPGRTHDAMRS